MDCSRPSKCTEPSCGTILHNGASHEAYPQPHSRPAAPVKCSIENCKWIGEITSHEEHRLRKHPPFIAEPSPLSDATHIVVQKEDHEELQDELGKLTHDLDQFRKLESEKEQEWREKEKEWREKEKEWREKEKEWREVKEVRERHEGKLMNCCKRISSQTLINVNPVIQRDVVANQQIEANSTASLGRAQQLPQQERSLTLNAQGSDFQQFLGVCEQEGDDHHGENYEQSQPQLEQQNQTREALPINIPAESELPPPLPPKPKRSTQNDSSSADLIPPKLPPKPNSNGGSPRSQEASRNAQLNDTIPPPRPPKPSQARPAVPQPQRRRNKSPPTPSQDYENDEYQAKS